MSEGLVERITAYLSGGGLVNPELAIHDAVRDLLIDCRAALSGDYVRVPREIDRSKHRAALEVWNDCMMNSETLETTWAQLVRVLAAAQGREG
jgi:hypothetical protein